MPSIIRVLDDKTINQIAAGEVIENPASVVKELVENAIDAKASSITVEIKGGGRHLIRITDNGIGMGRDDAILCFERHATSKVAKLEDLSRLVTMGFRGEALPSIGSISKVQLKTRPEGEKEGTLVLMEGGALRSVSAIAANLGTTFEVSDLFYNVPARKKFLKSPAYDVQEIQKTLTELALANPKIHFQLISDAKEIFDLPGESSLKERAGQLLHPEITDQMLSLEFEEEGKKLIGLISPPHVHRPNRTGQSLFINKRPVTSWAVSQAVLDGYSTALPERRHPLFVLHLTMPEESLDVNVHPQKREVRLSQEADLRAFIRRGIEKGLSISTAQSFEPLSLSMPKLEFSPVQETFSARPAPFAMKFDPPTFFDAPKKEELPEIIGSIPFYLLLERSPERLEEEPGICLLDHNLARSRILYEEILKGLKKGEAQKQLLLLPMTLEFSREESALLSEMKAEIETCGFILRPFGKTTFQVDAIPAEMREEEVQEVLRSFLEMGKEASQEVRFQKMAHAALLSLKKEKAPLSREMGKHVLLKLLACQQPYYSPTGRALFAWVTFDALGRFFK